jgi:hypothetical protein
VNHEFLIKLVLQNYEDCKYKYYYCWKIYKLMFHNLLCSAYYPSPVPFNYDFKSAKIYKNCHRAKMISRTYGDPYSESQNPEGTEIPKVFPFL